MTQKGHEIAEANQEKVPPKTVSWFRRMVRCIGMFLLFYVVTVVVGLVPVNNGFEPATENGVTIYVSSNAVHSDIIVPVVNDVFDWREEFPETDFGAKLDYFTHVAIGWGDRGFFLETPEWKDLRATTAANAILWPSDTVMHVQFTRPRTSKICRTVAISREAYQELVAYMLDSFESAAGSRERIPFSYDKWDAFYNAQGSYHLFNTCNCWVGGGLKACGVRTPCFSPMPRTVLWYLPD